MMNMGEPTAAAMHLPAPTQRADELHLARKCLARIRLDSRLDCLCLPDQADLRLVELGLDPDGMQVGDLELPRFEGTFARASRSA